jgi:hypothetical protein
MHPEPATSANRACRHGGSAHRQDLALAVTKVTVTSTADTTTTTDTTTTDTVKMTTRRR